MDTFLDKLLKEKGYPDLRNLLIHKLSGSELNTLLLDAIHQRLSSKSPHQLLEAYRTNRFTRNAQIDVLAFQREELKIMELMVDHKFELLELSPVAPLGCASTYGTVHQNKVISALRHTEVVADCTNVLALEIASRIKAHPQKLELHLATNHRLVRAQGLNNPAYTTHFKVGALVSSVKDNGHYQMETKLVLKHLSTYMNILEEVYSFTPNQLQVILQPINNANLVEQTGLITSLQRLYPHLNVITDPINDPGFAYYHTLRVQIRSDQFTFPIVDCGFVNWLSVLAGNQKLRLFISGIGTELLHKSVAKNNDPSVRPE